jgi:Sec-independent protein translocase protein TatA
MTSHSIPLSELLVLLVVIVIVFGIFRLRGPFKNGPR